MSASMCGVKVFLGPHPVDLFDLLEPLELEIGVPFHCFCHPLRQIGLEASSEGNALRASQQAILRIERFKCLRIVLDRLVHVCS